MIPKMMNFCSFSIVIILFLLLQLFHLLLAFADNARYVPSENIVLSCGSNSSGFLSYDGRNWSGDVGSPHLPFDADFKSRIATAPVPLASIPQVPYMTARIFQSQFTYRFNVTPGPKFIRLHFYPTSYLGLNVSKSFLSVTAGNLTFLHNFSASLNTDYFNPTYLVKEFIIHVRDRTLELTFSPTSNASDAYAFVNGIEIVSMPLNLYIRGDNAPLPLAGHLTEVLYINNNCALETMHRINVGGDDIPPKNDTGMFRTWTRDLDFLFGASGLDAFDMQMPVLYSATVPAYTAPASVYQTARSMIVNWTTLNLNYNLTWLFPVDSGFNYLIRLHFCEVDREITKVNQRTFNIYLNNQTAQEGADVIAWGGRRSAPVYEDYVVMIPESSMGKQDMWLDLHPDVEAKPEYYNVILNGVEIFKLSYTDGNLAGINPRESKFQSNVHAQQIASPGKPKKIVFISIGCGFGAVALSLLLCLLFYRFKLIKRRSMSCFCIFLHAPSLMRREKQSSSQINLSVDEIRDATNNFDEALIVGTGGFGKVYKGSFDGGATFVAIKRGNPMSEQGASEFQTEIQNLSQLRHHNLVSLIGYCKEEGEMILIYDFMVNGTLFDHLHMQGGKSPLSWIQRLEICIGVAKGLHYLHTGTGQKIIHRDIKTTNILLDHNWVAKISDFGLSKASFPSLSNTNVKGTIGYLDPEYFRCQRLSEKSDVYSFGVVLLEVLSARPALSPVEDEEHANLADWARYCFEKSIIDQLLDPKLQGKIVTESLDIYLGVAKKCLAEKAMMRPLMGEVLQDLALALQLQKNADSAQNRVVHIEENTSSNNNSDMTPGIEFSEIMMPLGR
ncbi:hypothetical protein L6164_001882 [Bauhinia variegata]|uniref:Uncharacterized protein n=1 Tax=Bauhinia variegata TaxID=167791 RepID=A0ACB9QAE5_BAUVA|nr:hypothetical protein L6164_001882 [Bauhinia variegata]